MNTLNFRTLTAGHHTLEDGTTLFVKITEPGAFSYKSGDRTISMYRYNRIIDAFWLTPSGVEIHARNTPDEATYRYNGVDRTRRSELTKKTRVYAHADVPFNVLEDLENRGRRPHQVYRPLVIEALASIGLTDIKLNWSQHAGCTCACSPGFILTGDNPMGIHMWVTLPGVPTVDNSKPGRKVEFV